MRFLIKASLPVETANKAMKDGTFGATMQSILADMKPEAAYFTDDDGERCGYFVVDMQDASQLPAMAEPLFLALNASITVKMVMTPEDLGKAGPAIEQAARKYA
jgi:hypothetical protein